MKIGDFLYFAPDIKFAEVDLSGSGLPKQYEARIEGFYLTPAELLADSGHGFASGLLVLSAIDSLARHFREEGAVGNRIKAWLRSEIGGLESARQAASLYHEVRNGLVHEARLKSGVQFSLEQDVLVDEPYGVITFNPKCLLDEVRKALSGHIHYLESNPRARQIFLEVLKEQFADEFKGLSGASRSAVT